MDIVERFRQFDYLREAGPNRGLRVESVQHWAAGQYGDSWCAEMWWYVHDIHFKGAFEIPREQSTVQLMALLEERGYAIDAADVQPGDTFFYVHDDGTPHHVGVVTVADPLTGIAGNTSKDGTSSNGDRCAEHALAADPAHLRFYRIPGVVV